MNLTEARNHMIDMAIEQALHESVKLQADANVASRSEDPAVREKGKEWAAEADRLAARAVELENIRDNDRTENVADTY